MRIGVIGASGRMGQALQAKLQEQGSDTFVAIVGERSQHLGQAVANTHYQALSQLRETPDVLIDFSLPQALSSNLAYAQQQQVPIVVCTTGLDAEQQQSLQQAAKHIPLLYARNTSIGVALLEQLTALSAAAMADADVEILEAHHRHKKDAPSGTAIALGEAAARGRQQVFTEVDAGLRGEGERQPGSIGFAVLRAADIVGEHQVMLAQTGERIELSHRVSDRGIFAKGALQAAHWLVKQPVGSYKMQDILNLSAVLQRLLKD